METETKTDDLRERVEALEAITAELAFIVSTEMQALPVRRNDGWERLMQLAGKTDEEVTEWRVRQ